MAYQLPFPVIKLEFKIVQAVLLRGCRYGTNVPLTLCPCFTLKLSQPTLGIFLHGFVSVLLLLYAYALNQYCFICRPSDSTVSEDAGIERRIVAFFF